MCMDTEYYKHGQCYHQLKSAWAAKRISTMPALQNPLMAISGHFSMAWQFEMIQLVLLDLITVAVTSTFSLSMETSLSLLLDFGGIPRLKSGLQLILHSVWLVHCMSMGCNLSVQLAGIWAETTWCFLTSDVMSDVVCPWKQSNRTRAGCEVSKSSAFLFLAKKGTIIISIAPMVVSVPDVPACWYRYGGASLSLPKLFWQILTSQWHCKYSGYLPLVVSICDWNHFFSRVMHGPLTSWYEMESMLSPWFRSLAITLTLCKYSDLNWHLLQEPLDQAFQRSHSKKHLAALMGLFSAAYLPIRALSSAV